jgi:8-oxo-dGTP diphosphatase
LTPTILQFGEAVTGIEYALRPGGYSIVKGPGGTIAVASTSRGYFLPGGGQNGDESPEAAAVREATEECGLRIRILRCLGVADELVYALDEETYFRKRCTFFTAELVRQEGCGEADHHLVWITADVARAQLEHGSQRWAVAEAFADLPLSGTGGAKSSMHVENGSSS